MSERLRVLLLIFIMSAVAMGSAGMSLFNLYQTALEEESQRLVDTVKSQAGIMGAMARFNARYLFEDALGSILSRTIEEIADAHDRFEGFGETGEFTLAKKQQDEIVFLLKQRHGLQEHPQPVLLSSKLAEPMRRALAGESGTIVGLDYRGQRVLAAYEPVAELGFGLVAKIDFEEIQAPFIRAGLLAGAYALAFVLLGSALFWHLTKPLLRSLKESEVKYRTIFENTPNSIFLMTDVLEDCNDQACQLFACGREELVGHSPIEFSPPAQPGGRDSAEADREHIEAALSGVPQFFNWQYRRKDGTLIDAEVFLKAIEVDARKLNLVISRDITERRQAEKALRGSEERVRLLLNSTAEAIYGLDLAGNCTFCNPSALRLLGYKKQTDLLGKKIHALIHHTHLDGTPYPEEECHACHAFRSGEGLHIKDEVFWHSDGTSFPVEYRSFPIRKKDEILGSVVTFLDITKRIQMEEALRASEELFRSVFEFAGGGMAIVTLEGEYLQVNKAYCRLLGSSEQELLKQNVLKFTHPDDREKTRHSLDELISGQLHFIEYEKRYLRKDEAVVWGHTTVCLVYDAKKKPLYFVGLVQDITERKRTEVSLKENEALLSVIFNESTQLMGLIKLDGTLIKINRTAVEVIGTDMSQVLDKPFWETPWWSHSPEEQKRLREAIRQAAQGEFVRFEATHPTPEGDLVYIDFSLKPVKDETGKVVLLAPEGRDITDRKRAEREIRQLNQELEARVIERTRELELANREMEAFTYSVSHDLRAPLRAIDGFSGALLEDYTDKLDEEGKTYLRYLLEGSRDMSALIDGLLKLARSTRGEMAREPVDLSALVAAVIQELRQAEPERQVAVQIEESLKADADPRLLKAVMENLLGNAWKYTGQTVNACIAFGAQQQDGETVFFVRDNGAGFDMAYADKLFLPFQRLHKTGEFSGTGIGLATVQRIIHRHGGRIWAHSEVGEGATFYFTLGPETSPHG